MYVNLARNCCHDCVMTVPGVMTLFGHRQELGKGINTDEAAAMGSVYQAAHLSKGFRVKKFAIKDANLFPIQVGHCWLWRYVSRWVVGCDSLPSCMCISFVFIVKLPPSPLSRDSSYQKASRKADVLYINRHTSCTLCRYDFLLQICQNKLKGNGFLAVKVVEKEVKQKLLDPYTSFQK